MKPALPSARQQQVLRLGVCALLAAAAVSGTAYRLVAMNRCAMDHDLLELLLYGTEQLQAANVPYWLEFGTLLGAVRDKAVVPWEFDVDLAVTEQQCERVLKLREKFAREKGYKMYGRGEYVPEKAALFGMVGGTISAPCVRVYSRDGTLPLDIYWSKVLTLTPDHTTPEGRRYIPPPDRSGDLISAALSASADSADSATAEQILCDHEAFTTDIGDHTSPCRWYNDIFPLTTTAMYGRQFPVPRRSRKILTQTYGPNWMTPKPKGYKALLCPPVWHTGSGAVYGVAAAGALALAAALFVYLRASYASALALSTAAPGSAAATAAAAAAKEKDAKAAAASGSDAALADAPGCCDRAFACVFRWTGVGAGAAASPALIGADADGDASDADADADPADPDHKRLHSV